MVEARLLGYDSFNTAPWGLSVLTSVNERDRFVPATYYQDRHRITIHFSIKKGESKRHVGAVAIIKSSCAYAPGNDSQLLLTLLSVSWFWPQSFFIRIASCIWGDFSTCFLPVQGRESKGSFHFELSLSCLVKWWDFYKNSSLKNCFLWILLGFVLLEKNNSLKFLRNKPFSTLGSPWNCYEQCC